MSPMYRRNTSTRIMVDRYDQKILKKEKKSFHYLKSRSLWQSFYLCHTSAYCDMSYFKELRRTYKKFHKPEVCQTTSALVGENLLQMETLNEACCCVVSENPPMASYRSFSLTCIFQKWFNSKHFTGSNIYLSYQAIIINHNSRPQIRFKEV